ncbi:hypothetical protein [Alkalibacterium pelagium]|jgi:hypothetical protein|uniref:Uncharacterized protein n=1 Tax=Alkalibacterium pelagium TaxID=426702 RepID=A0A1H7G294_9LACT|nr:hypothetical protein [Alkalibacterium pelagium]GEN49933.1 hypothetical protein APE02nite_05980 [Alkalibacterium pelagium]SEK32238.1 hypothetical protein SAMN04488099_10235 [Alkalibacterium pelagium]
MSKDNELKRPNHNERNNGGDDPAYNHVVSPDTSAPLGYIKDRPLRDKLSEEEVDRKAKGESPGNEVELDLNPNPDTESKDDTV